MILKTCIPGREIHAFIRQFHAAVGNMVIIEPGGNFPGWAPFIMQIGIEHHGKTERKTKKQVCRVGFRVVHLAEIGKSDAHLKGAV